MAGVPLFQVDAFTRDAFAGNPAAVCLLESWPDDEVLQRVAAENNLSETAYLVGEGATRELRWFTPAVEVDLCGHATLASAHVLFAELDIEADRLEFSTNSGVLAVTRADDGYELDLPVRRAEPIDDDPAVADALGVRPESLPRSRDIMAVVADAETVRNLRPNFARLAALDTFAVVVTAGGSGEDADVDFVSRFFAPREGIPEDPVTGSAHCTLAPYWAARLGKTRLQARQVSARGGEIFCVLDGNRVRLRGQAVTVMRGTLSVPGL